MKVHIHANCQAVPLAGMLSEVRPDWDISFFQVHADDIIERIDEHHRRIRTSDLVICQPVHKGYRDRTDLSIDWIRENVRRDATLLVIPSIHFAGHHPELDSLPLAGIPFLSSLLAAHLIASRLTPSVARDCLLSDELFRDQDIESEIQISLDEIRRREVDDRIDIQISPYLQEYCRIKPMFHIQNHPLREVMVFIANEVLAKIGCSERVPIKGLDYQPEPHVPLLPSIARYINAKRDDTWGPLPIETVLIHGFQPMTQDEYYLCMLEGLARYCPAEIFQAIKQRWPTVQVLRRLAAQGSTIPGITRWLEA
jgi:hypothetical protein